MSKPTQAGDNSARWVESPMPNNTTNCRISLFQPSIDGNSRKEASYTPERPLLSVEQEIKYESPDTTTPCPAKHGNSVCEDEEVDSVPYSSPQQPEDKNEEQATSNRVKEETDETENCLDKTPLLPDHATGQSHMQSGITQLEQYADGQDTPNSPSKQQLHDQPDATEMESESPSSDQEDLASLLQLFAVKRGTPGSSSASLTPPSKKRKLHHDPYLTPNRSSLSASSASYPWEKLTSTSMEDFYRQHSDQLPQNGKKHEWTFLEREALCLIHVFYQVDTAFKDLAKVLNELFQMPPTDSFRPKQLRSQWGVWRYVFRNRPVYNMKSEWSNKRIEYESAAARAGVQLNQRAEPLKEKTLSLKCAKTTDVVVTYDAWFLGQLLRSRNARQAPPTSPNSSPLAGRSSAGDDSILLQLVEAAESEGSSSPAHSSSQGPISSQESTSNVPANEEEGDTDDPPTPYRPAQASVGYAPASTPRTKRAKPALLYRVYHEDSGGLNEPTQFRAGLFNIPGQSMVPPPSDGSILPVFVSWHLWHHSVSSPFISCTDSLIMAMHKARRAEAAGLHPHLSVIDAARATSAGRGFPAGPLVAEARRRGLVPGMRYRGLREHLVWGAIPRSAIVHDLPFGALRSLPPRDTGVADLLALDDVDPAPRVGVARVRRALLGQAVVLGEAAAGHAAGRLAALLGLGARAAPPALEQLVYDVFQGWALGASGVRAMARGFLDGLRDAEGAAGAALVVLDDAEEDRVREAFVGGVERAQEDLKKERRFMRK